MHKILVIDDESDLLEGISDILRFEGYEIHVAQNGREGYDKIVELTPDLILCDILMPEVDGFQLKERLKVDTSLAVIPFIFISALSQKEVIRKGMNVGANDFLIKPFSRIDLLKTVHARLDAKQSHEIVAESSLNELRKNITISFPHELKTPLNSILGFTQVIKSNIDFLDTDELLRMVSVIDDSGHRMFDLVKKYLLYVELETSPEMIVDTCDTSIIDAIESSVSKCVLEFGRAEDIHQSGNPFSTAIRCEHLGFVLNEIINNAFKFSTAGDRISIEYYVKNERGFVSVSDEGDGIGGSAKVGAFNQIDREINEQQGLGVGLHLSNEILKRYNGKMFIRNNTPKGTVVKLEFPLANHSN